MTHLTRLSLANRLMVGLVDLGHRRLRRAGDALPAPGAAAVDPVPTAIVTATYPGTSPEIVADEVATPIEQAISGVSGVTKVRSRSPNGLATITVQWEYGLDSDEVVGDIRSAIDGGRRTLPDAVETECWPAAPTTSRCCCSAVASDAPAGELARLVDNVAVPQLSGGGQASGGCGHR